jgi:hypothetical protein
MDLRSIGLLFYLTGSAPTVAEALENLARYSRTTNEALVVEISRQKDEVILAIRHLQEFDEPHRQFFELLALWFVRMLRKETNRDFTLSRVTFTHARNADLREVHRLLPPCRLVGWPIWSASTHGCGAVTHSAGSHTAEAEFAGLAGGAKGIRTFGPTFVCSVRSA